MIVKLSVLCFLIRPIVAVSIERLGPGHPLRVFIDVNQAKLPPEDNILVEITSKSGKRNHSCVCGLNSEDSVDPKVSGFEEHDIVEYSSIGPVLLFRISYDFLSYHVFLTAH